MHPLDSNNISRQESSNVTKSVLDQRNTYQRSLTVAAPLDEGGSAPPRLTPPPSLRGAEADLFEGSNVAQSQRTGIGLAQGLVGLALSSLCCALLGCTPSIPDQSAPPQTDSAKTSTNTEPQQSPCVDTYDPAVDYFPDKVKLRYAQGFAVSYHNHYKVVTVVNPWREATTQFQYVLVQCGTPVPEGFEQAQVVEIPVQRIVVLSTTHLSHLERLDALDTLVGVDRFDHITTEAVRQKIGQGELTEVGNDSTLNIESILALQPDLVTTFGLGNPETDTHPKLLELGVPTAVLAEYLETTPLGQTEWLKFTALFLNRETQAQDKFEAIAQDYEQLVALAKTAVDRPTVLVGFSYNGTWYVPGGNSFAAQFLKDAGANYVWSDTDTQGSIPLSFESVFAQAATVDYWLNVSQDWRTLDDAIADDERYGTFQPWQTGQVFNNDARVNPQGGNDYWESGVLNPHVILADLIKLFHPDLLPEHELFYYRQLE